MNWLISKIRYRLLNKRYRPKHSRRELDVPYIGPEQWLLLTSNQKWRERYERINK